MITYFPTPYPNEWWYSILCRYYVRSGFCNFSDIIMELYQGKRGNAVLRSAGSILCILQQLPDIGFSARDAILNHTLTPYYCRFSSAEQKAEELDMLTSNPKSISKYRAAYGGKMLNNEEGPKYCPKCYEEDKEKYGEPYWHREHQLPLLSLCPHHGCALQQYPLKLSNLKDGFYPLSDIRVVRNETGRKTRWEYPLTKMLYSFLTLPFDVAPARGSESLYNAMLLHSSLTKISNGCCCVDLDKLKLVCFNYYGQSIAMKYFSGLSSAGVSIIKRWESSSPERYALLSVLCGITAEELFGIIPQSEESQLPPKKSKSGGGKARKGYVINSKFSMAEMKVLGSALQMGQEKDLFKFVRKAVLETAYKIIMSDSSST